MDPKGVVGKYFRVVSPQNPEEILLTDHAMHNPTIGTEVDDDGVITNTIPSFLDRDDLVKIRRSRDRAQGWTRLANLELHEWPVGYPFRVVVTITSNLMTAVGDFRSVNETQSLNEIRPGRDGKILGYRKDQSGREEVILQIQTGKFWVPFHYLEVGPAAVGNVQFRVRREGNISQYRPTTVYWTRIGETDDSITLRCSSQKVIHRKPGSTIATVHFLDGLPYFSIRDADVLGLEYGDLVYPTVEIKPPGQRHPKCWSRQMTVGPWSDWNLGETVALKIQWLTQSGWKQAYFSTPNTDYLKKIQSAVYVPYLLATTIRRYLLRQTLENGIDVRRGFDYGLTKPPRIRYLTFDYYNQTLSVDESMGFNETIPPPKKKSLREIGDELMELGMEQATSDLSEAPRAICDGCYLNEVACEPNFDMPCLRCSYYGLPCSFTSPERFTNDPQLVRALRPDPQSASVAETIEPPKFLDLEIEFVREHFRGQ